VLLKKPASELQFAILLLKKQASEQGDQIGRIFANGRLFTLGSCFKMTEVAHIAGLPVSHSASYVFILTENCLGYILGDSFANSSGHPASELVAYENRPQHPEAHFTLAPTISSKRDVAAHCSQSSSGIIFFGRSKF
jgi:hypothetical protein